MEIEVGDIVQLKDKTVFAGLTVVAIEGENAICKFYVPNEPLDGAKRPSALVQEEGVFPLEDLIISRKG